MEISEELLAALRCPETKQKLTLASDGQLARINAGIQDAAKIEGALIREDQRVAYPIDDGFPILLLSRQIKLGLSEDP